MKSESDKKLEQVHEKEQLLEILDQYAAIDKKSNLLEMAKNIDAERKKLAIRVLDKRKNELKDSLLSKFSNNPAASHDGHKKDDEKDDHSEAYHAQEEHEEVQEAEPWIITFADMVSLLMGFFIIMFSMSMVDTEKFKKAVDSLKNAFSATDGEAIEEVAKEIGAGQPIKIDTVGGKVNREIKNIETSVAKFVDENELHGKIHVSEDSRGVVINIADRMLFPIGKAAFFPEIIPILAKLKDVIIKFDYQIRVEGHTDDVPISTPQYPSNWELSAGRACELVKFLIENGIPPERISAEGYAHYHPIVQDITPEARAKNRRVEIILTREDIYRKVWDQTKNKSKPGQTEKEKENELIEQRLKDENGGDGEGARKPEEKSSKEEKKE